MANVIIDSCTYGKMIKDANWEKLVEEIIKTKSFIVFNFRVIRDELRKAPKQVLTIYDQIVSTNMIQENKTIVKLAEGYYNEYKKNGGGKGKKKILNDFKIVACASIKNCDILFSDDDSTLKCKNALDAYRKVNINMKYRTPKFYSILDLKSTFLTS